MAIDPEQIRQGGPMSAEEYIRLDQDTWNGKYEYLDGTARLMSGATAEHSRIALNIYTLLNRQFASKPCTVFGSDVRVLIGSKADGHEHYVYPDATVSCDVADRRRGVKLIQSPRIVVEVLSPGTEATDRGRKLAAYKACPPYKKSCSSISSRHTSKSIDAAKTTPPGITSFLRQTHLLSYQA